MRIHVAVLSAAVFTSSAFVFISNFAKKRSAAQIESFLASRSIFHEKPILVEGTFFNPRYVIPKPTFSFKHNREEYLISDKTLSIKTTSQNGYEITSSNNMQITVLPLGPHKPDFIPQTYSFSHSERPAFTCRFAGDVAYYYGTRTNSGHSLPDDTELNCSIPANAKLLLSTNGAKLAQSLSPAHLSFAYAPSPDHRKGRISISSDLNLRFFSPPSDVLINGGFSEEIFSLIDDLKGDQRFTLKASYTGTFSASAIGDAFSFTLGASSSSPTADSAIQFNADSARHADNKLAIKLKSDVRFSAKPDFKLAAQKRLGSLDSSEPPLFSSDASFFLSRFIYSLPDKERMIPEFMNLIPDFYALGPLKHSLSADFILSAPLQSSHYQLSSLKVNEVNFEVGNRKISGSGFVNISSLPEGRFKFECTPCESTLKEALNYASEVERFSSHLAPEPNYGHLLTDSQQSALLSFAKEISEPHDKRWVFRASFDNGNITLGSYPLEAAMSKLSQLISRSEPPSSAPENLNRFIEDHDELLPPYSEPWVENKSRNKTSNPEEQLHELPSTRKDKDESGTLLNKPPAMPPSFRQ